jgi:ABC-type transport system substrate-binding protein
MKRRSILGGLPAAAWVVWPGFARPAEPAKVLRLAFPAAESALDPPQTNSSLYSNTILAHILEAPLTYDYLARPVRLLPQTAVALPELSADFRTITLNIRAGIFFSDDPAFKGQPRELTAHDYVYAIKRYYDPRLNSSDLYLFQNAKLLGLTELRERAVKNKQPFDYDAEAEGVRALGRYRLQLRLGVPDPRFMFHLATPGLTGAVAREVVEFYGSDIVAHPVGTGPFRLAAWRRASRIELERSPSYRGTPYQGTPAEDPIAQRAAARLAGRRLPLVDRVVVDIVEEDQPRWLTFLNGEHHFLQVPGPFVPLAVPGGKLAPFLVKKRVHLQSQLQADMQMQYFNMRDPLVGGNEPAKVALRRAIALSHDGDEYVRLVRGGAGLKAQSIVPPFTSGYSPAYRSEMSTYSPSRARALLDLYGYADRNGDGWRETPEGQPLLLRIASMSDQLSRVANEVWQRSLNAVGLRVEFETSTWPELLNKSRAGSLMMWGYGWTAATPDGGFFLAIGYGPNAGEANDSRFSLPAYDRLFERQNRLPDGPERDAVMEQAKNLMVAYMPYKVFTHRVIADLVQRWTHNYWRHPFMRDIWQYIDVE